MPTGIAVALIIFCGAALIISLYCLFFMVQEKRFWERIRSLGGGLKGIETDVNSVRDEIGRRLGELESATQEQVVQAREATEAALDTLANDSREARRELERVRKDLQALQAELRETAADSMKVSRGTAQLTEQLQQMRTDFDVLDVELRESVRQQVASSFSSVESTVLSALEAIQGEIVYGVANPPGSGKRSRPGKDRPHTPPSFTRGPGRRTPENIITVQPLFDDLEEDDEGPPSDQDSEGEPEPEETTTDEEGAEPDKGQ